MKISNTKTLFLGRWKGYIILYTVYIIDDLRVPWFQIILGNLYIVMPFPELLHYIIVQHRFFPAGFSDCCRFNPGVSPGRRFWWPQKVSSPALRRDQSGDTDSENVHGPKTKPMKLDDVFRSRTPRTSTLGAAVEPSFQTSTKPPRRCKFL